MFRLLFLQTKSSKEKENNVKDLVDKSYKVQNQTCHFVACRQNGKSALFEVMY